MVRKEESEKPAAAGAGRAKRLALQNNKQFKNWIASQRGGGLRVGRCSQRQLALNVHMPEQRGLASMWGTITQH